MDLISLSLQWLRLHWLEAAGTLTGLLYVLYTIRKSNLLWLFGGISSALYIIVFYQSRIYAYMIVYAYYVGMSFYGWYNWTRIRRVDGQEEAELQVKRVDATGLFMYMAASLITGSLFYLLLRLFTDSDTAVADAVLSASSMTATWMLARKILQHWLFWIAIDMASLGLMIYKGLYPSALLFLTYTVLAIKGYIEWKKE